MPERLERSTTNRMWSGVCGGIAEYFQLDPTLVRAFFVIATIFTGGVFFLVYIALIVFMPVRGQGAPGMVTGAPPSSGATPSTGAPGPSDAAASPTPPLQPAPWHDPAASARRREGAGWFLLALGVVFLLSNVGAFRFVQWGYIWPIALIALGAFIVLQRSRP